MQKCKENYSCPPKQNIYKTQLYNSPSYETSYVENKKSRNPTMKTILNTGEPLPFCNDQMSIDPPAPFVVSLNQKLTLNEPNPKTKIKPVIVSPSYDLDSWRDNTLITYSMVNKPRIQEEMYLSGYAESSCCDYLPVNSELVPREERENFGIVSPRPVDDTPFIPSIPVRENFGIVSPRPVDDTPFIPSIPVRENYSNVKPNYSGWVNTTCGYNDEQLNVYLPSNLPVGNCYQDPHMKGYNKNLFTQIVSPGTYTLNQVNEPINSNIGISFTQQFEPVSCKRNEKGLQYTLHDPRVYDYQEPVKEKQNVNYGNVYDPRFYGYGTSYRSYYEPITGQTRFMYDDVNAVRMPNYITRSKIDHLPYADKYDSMSEGSEFGNIHNPQIRNLVQDSWLRDSVSFRDDLQQSLMRKVNAEGWQKRMFPNSSRPVGSYVKRRN